MGGVFPKGLVIGKVVLAEQGKFGLFQQVDIEPSTDFSHLEEVLVLLDEEVEQ
jgi:rod shape-determining protein MreC